MNNLNDLNEQLFLALDRLNKADNDSQLQSEISRSQAVSSVACQLINSFALKLKAEEMMSKTHQLKKSADVIVPIEDLNKPRVVRDKNFYKSVK